MDDKATSERVKSFAEQQYETADNLNARQRLHVLFSTNPVNWQRWAFEQFNIPADARILELGCGNGTLWTANQDRIPGGWRVILSDFSPGMLDEARRNLDAVGHNFEYMVVNAQEIPFSDESMDTVIADHMLYHVPDLAQGLSEIRRVLKPGGHLYATTTGQSHLQELDELLDRVGLPTMASQRSSVMAGFHLENGVEVLSAWFDNVEFRQREDSLDVTEVEPLIAYILSDISPTADQLSEMRRIVEEEIARKGAYHITKSAGMFVASLML